MKKNFAIITREFYERIKNLDCSVHDKVQLYDAIFAYQFDDVPITNAKFEDERAMQILKDWAKLNVDNISL